MEPRPRGSSRELGMISIGVGLGSLAVLVLGLSPNNQSGIAVFGLCLSILLGALVTKSKLLQRSWDRDLRQLRADFLHEGKQLPPSLAGD